jgi:hypothetical protein
MQINGKMQASGLPVFPLPLERGSIQTEVFMKTLACILSFCIILSLPDPLVQRMAQVAKGESATAPDAVACVMRNRILAGWNPEKVLNHFYASPRAVTDEEVKRIANVLRTGEGCDHRAYFQWSKADVEQVRPRAESFLFEAGGNFFYDKHALRREQ